MPATNLKKFFLSIVVPSFLTILLFIVSIYALIIPSFEDNMMDRKKEMISELTHTVWSLANNYYQDVLDSILTSEEAKLLAASKIEKMRYGADRKDYFWICTMEPRMVMHPYRQELMGQGLLDYEDPNGKKLFVEAVEIVEQSEDGFIDYFWQWKDDSTRIVPKLSYVKAYEPWGWVIGTGIYLEDVRAEIKALEKNLLWASSLVAVLISLLLACIIRQSLRIERKRKSAEKELLLSRQKYKSLVEASSEGTLMMLGQDIIFANQKMAEKLSCSPNEILARRLPDLFDLAWEDLEQRISQPNKSLSFETKIVFGENAGQELILSVSKVEYDNRNAFIVAAKDITWQQRLDSDTTHLEQELQASLLLMNQPVKDYAKDILSIQAEKSVAEVAQLMVRKKSEVVFLEQNGNLIGYVNRFDMAERVVAKNLATDIPAFRVMTAPVEIMSGNVLLAEGILLCRKKGVDYFTISNFEGKPNQMVSLNDMLGSDRFSHSFILKDIRQSESVLELKDCYQKLSVLMKALINSSANVQTVSRVVSAVADAIVQRLIVLLIEELGATPCKFAFMVLGSQGRREQSLATDQDNAFVLEDLDKDVLPVAQKYFQHLGTKLNKGLHVIGYDLCPGEVMARNPRWVQSLSTWKKYFNNWLLNSDPQSVLEASIFFDFRCLYGAASLVDQLQNHVRIVSSGKAVFFQHTSQSIVKFKPPLSLFGNIVDESEGNDGQGIDLKKLLFPLVGFARLYAIKHGLDIQNTIERFDGLLGGGHIPKKLYTELMQSFEFLMLKRFQTQVGMIMEGHAPTNILPTENLSEIEKTILKKIMSDISLLQSQLNFDFKGTV